MISQEMLDMLKQAITYQVILDILNEWIAEAVRDNDFQRAMNLQTDWIIVNRSLIKR